MTINIATQYDTGFFDDLTVADHLGAAARKLFAPKAKTVATAAYVPHNSGLAWRDGLADCSPASVAAYDAERAAERDGVEATRLAAGPIRSYQLKGLMPLWIYSLDDSCEGCKTIVDPEAAECPACFQDRIPFSMNRAVSA